MASGYTDVAVTSHDTMRFSWSEGSQSVVNNTTVVNWSLTLIADSNGRISTSNTRAWAVTFNGVNYSGSSSAAVANSSTITLASGSTTVTHGSDGTKSASYSFSYNFSGITFSGTALGLVSGSGTAALTRIPRASSITVPKFTMGTAGSITITRADSSFTHTLTWKFGAASGTIATKTTATSVSWTPATATLAPQIPKATSGTGTITCTTYSGSTAIGTSSVSFTATVPASVVPSISSVTVKEATSGLAAKFGVFVQNRSTFAVTVSAAGSNGSTVAAITTKFQGVTYSGDSFTAAAAKTSGSLNMETTVTDSRGRTDSKRTEIAVVAYANPAISAFTVSRCDADGNLNNAGSYVKIAYAYSVVSVNSKNTASARIDYKRTTATAWSSTVLFTNTDLSANTSVIPTTQFDPDYSYDFRLTLADYFTSTAYAAAISSQAVILDVLPDGTGVAFGKVAETKNLLDSKWPIKTDGGITAVGTFTTPLTSGTYIAGNQGKAIINSTAAAGAYVMLAKLNSTNGYFCIGVYQNAFCLCYTAKNTVDAGTNTVTKRVNLLDESGNTTFPGTVTAASFACTSSSVLWSGALYMIGSHTVTLSAKVSSQPNGIVLVFSKYSNGAAQDSNFNRFFIPKRFVASYNGYGHECLMMASDFSKACCKYLYVFDDHIKGHDNNTKSGTGSNGITYDNSNYVLRYVIGV